MERGKLLKIVTNLLHYNVCVDLSQNTETVLKLLLKVEMQATPLQFTSTPFLTSSISCISLRK